LTIHGQIPHLDSTLTSGGGICPIGGITSAGFFAAATDAEDDDEESEEEDTDEEVSSDAEDGRRLDSSIVEPVAGTVWSPLAAILSYPFSSRKSGTLLRKKLNNI
jgi:hypothetical protein